MNQKKVWNEIAPSWSKYRNKTLKTVKDFLKGKKGKILDIGCGSGRNFAAQEGLEFYGIDFSKNMISLAKIQADKLNIKAHLSVQEADNLNFRENFFDNIICFSVLNCIKSDKKRKESLKEINRVLKPKGKVLISSWGKNSSRLKSKEKECEVPWTTAKDKKVKRYTYTYNLSELEKECKEAGFRITKTWEDENVNLILEK